jgi:hypothetical protein
MAYKKIFVFLILFSAFSYFSLMDNYTSIYDYFYCDYSSETDGLIYEKNIKGGGNGRNNTKKYNIRYLFEAEGKKYESGKIYFGDMLDDGYESYDIGEKIKVFYDKNKHGCSILNKKFEFHRFYRIPLMLALVFLGVWAFTNRYSS